VNDILSFAVKATPEHLRKSTSEEPTAKALRDLFSGLTMTQAEFIKILKRHGIETLDPVGQKFDPNLHEALFEIPDPSGDAGVVKVVQKIGYTLNGRVIRPAQVGVSRK
jgi:molecular chaperone GrpE